jgi:zinc protease
MATVFMASAAPARAALKPLKIPELQESTTSTGLRVVVAERGPLPLVSIRLVVRAGSAFDPPGKHGLADFTARLLRRGTKRLSADQINEAVEFVGGTLGTGAAEDTLSLFISAPAEHLDAMMDVLGQLLREPTFPPAEVESARRRVLAQIANDLDDPGEIADRAFLKAVWGDHPYGHEVVGRRSHIEKFTRDDVVNFHRDRIGPRVSTLLVVGAVDAKAVFAAAERAFAGFSGGPSSAVDPPGLERAAMAGGVVIVDKPDQTQTQVRIGGAGLPKGHPDAFAIAAFNTVLGGSFTSRLVTEIRVKRGLSYGASSHFVGLKSAGTFQVGSFTKTESTREILDVALAQLKRMREKGPTPAELKTAQSYVAGIYPARIETNESLASALTEVLIYGLPADWVQKFRDRLSAVTQKEAAAAAAKYLLKDPPAIVLVGKASEIAPLVKDLGKVTVLNVSDVD